MKVIIKNGVAIATHEDHQIIDAVALYGEGAMIIDEQNSASVLGGIDANGNVMPPKQYSTEQIAAQKTAQTVTMRQARLALLGAEMLTDVNNAIAAMTGEEGEAARIEWEYAATVVRGSPLVAGLAEVLELDEAALDNLFATAAGL